VISLKPLESAGGECGEREGEEKGKRREQEGRAKRKKNDLQ
jgi:hypothetical protein